MSEKPKPTREGVYPVNAERLNALCDEYVRQKVEKSNITRTRAMEMLANAADISSKHLTTNLRKGKTAITQTTAVRLAHAFTLAGLAVEPTELMLQPDGAAPQQHPDARLANFRATERESFGHLREDALFGVPEPFGHWIGRNRLLGELTVEWAGKYLRAAELIGAGGEGKSSLVRTWVDQLRTGDLERPEGVFWWNFYSAGNIEQFLAEALSYFGRICGGEPQAVTTADRVLVLANLLRRELPGGGRFVLVLDGLEVYQVEAKGESSGNLLFPEMRHFLQMACSEYSRSFCIITSRVGLTELHRNGRFSHHRVEPLQLDEGVALLRKFGVDGADAELAAVVEKCERHALTLTLVGTYLQRWHEGKLAALRKLRWPRLRGAARLQQVLAWHDDRLPKAARTFMRLFSALRTPITLEQMIKLCRTAAEDSPEVSKLLAGLGDNSELPNLVSQLINDQILTLAGTSDGKSRQGEAPARSKGQLRYTIHPLIHEFYSQQFESFPAAQLAVWHRRLQFFYRNQARAKEVPTLPDLAPYIEAIYHGCRAANAGAPPETSMLAWMDILQHLAIGDRYCLVLELGAWETAVRLLEDFFPNRDTAAMPLLRDPAARTLFLTFYGFALSSLGRVEEGVTFLRRAINTGTAQNADTEVSLASRNLAEVYLYLGELRSSRIEAEESVRIAEQVGDDPGRRNALIYLAWGSFLNGNQNAMAQSLDRCEVDLQSGRRADLYGVGGLLLAEWLCWVGDMEAAIRVASETLAVCETRKWLNQVSRCHRLLADLNAPKDSVMTNSHLDRAVSNALRTSFMPPRVEAFTARARFANESSEPRRAEADIDEALSLAKKSRLLLHEIDASLVFAELCFKRGDSVRALRLVNECLMRSEDTGYFWGQRNATRCIDRFGL